MKIHLTPPTTAKAEDLPEVAGLLQAVFGRERDWAAEIPWQYLENPCGPAWYVNARSDEGELVGHYTVIPTPKLNDPRFHHLRAYLSLNTAVHPKAQGQGIFKKTANALYQHLQSLHPSIVLGVANANSAPGFINSLGFYSLGRLSLQFFPPWKTPPVMAERTLAADLEFLRWRTRRPGARLFKEPSSGSILRAMSHRGVPIMGVLSVEQPGDLLSGLSLPKPGAQRLLAPQLYASSCEGLSGGLPVPERLRPSPLHYICRLLPDTDAAPLVNFLRTRRFEFLDFDVV
jgi:GNAT superfamily N-acetyltransferase